MNTPRTADYLQHMTEAASLACDYVEGLEKADFLNDKKTQQAVIMNLLIIGEAATKVIQTDQSFFEKNQHIPWMSMKGMRNRIAHGYFEINLDVVWNTVSTALPKLLGQLQALNCRPE